MIEHDTLLEQIGSPFTPKVVDRLYRFAYLPDSVITRLSSDALSEDWGRNNYVLTKYLAAHIAWSIEQSRYTFNGNQLCLAAGSLQTRYGTPLFLAFEPNREADKQPWALVYAGSQITAAELPLPPEIPDAADVPRDAEIVMMHDHILGDHADRVTFLKETPPVAQMCAVAGAIQWSLNRGLAIPYWYYGRMQKLVPLYLTSRENITVSPDLIAPIEVSAGNLLVRTVLPPHSQYPNSRIAVRRHDQLPSWMLDCWNTRTVDDDDPREDE